MREVYLNGCVIVGSHLEVQASSFVTSSNSSDLDLAGMHFCKLLSPAKAIEFIYVDALYETFYLETIQ